MVAVAMLVLTLLVTTATMCGSVLGSPAAAGRKNSVLRGSTKNASARNKSDYKIVCYYTNWSQYRPKTGKFQPEDIDPFLCTHILYAFGWIKKGKLSSFEDTDESKLGKKGLYDRIMELKKKNPQLKVLLAVGGWSFGTEKFKEASSTRYSRQTFVFSAIDYLRQRKFDGLDLDWEYPKGEDDKKNFVALLRDLRDAFESEAKEKKQPRLLLSAAVPAGADSIRSGYDVPSVAELLDFIDVMAYDFHGKWESTTGHNSPLYAPSNDSNWRKQLCMDFAANMWVRLGAPREKLIIGLGTYGRSFTLSNSKKNGVNAASSGGGKAGPYTREAGFLAYYEICEMLKNGATYVWDEEMKSPYAYDGDQWVGFDDERSFKEKLKWLKENNFGGAMVWTVDMDDFNGICGGGKYPLIGLIRQELRGVPRPQGAKIIDWASVARSRKNDIEIVSVTSPASARPARRKAKLLPEPKSLVQFDPAAPKIVCYYTTWSARRTGRAKFLPEDVNPSLCTHLVIAFATLVDGRLAASDSGDEGETKEKGLYARVLDLKKHSPALKIILALGGWEFGTKPFKQMTESNYKRNLFVYEAAEFLRKHSFDGLEIDWEYPNSDTDKERHTQLIKDLRESFEGEAKSNKLPRLLLAAGVSSNPAIIDRGYDIPEISKALDLINVMTYDYHGQWEKEIGHNSPLYPLDSATEPQKKLTVDSSAAEWVKKGAPKEKLMIGIPTYGRSFTLADPDQFDIGAPATGGGKAGKYMGETGFMSFYEVCDMLRDNATLVWDGEQQVPFAYKGDQWVGFDDERSVQVKMEWLKKNGYGGVMVWALDMDDSKGVCGGGAFPLLNVMKKELEGYAVPTAALSEEGSIVYGTAVQSLGAKTNELVCAEEDGHISYHRDEEDCSMYYMCEGDRRHHMPCPVNLVFNVNENVCDWPENVEACHSQDDSGR